MKRFDDILSDFRELLDLNEYDSYLLSINLLYRVNTDVTLSRQVLLIHTEHSCQFALVLLWPLSLSIFAFLP